MRRPTYEELLQVAEREVERAKQLTELAKRSTDRARRLREKIAAKKTGGAPSSSEEDLKEGLKS